MVSRPLKVDAGDTITLDIGEHYIAGVFGLTGSSGSITFRPQLPDGGNDAGRTKTATVTAGVTTLKNIAGQTIVIDCAALTGSAYVLFVDSSYQPQTGEA